MRGVVTFVGRSRLGYLSFVIRRPRVSFKTYLKRYQHRHTEYEGVREVQRGIGEGRGHPVSRTDTATDIQTD
jgi:hypothetical protein